MCTRSVLDTPRLAVGAENGVRCTILTCKSGTGAGNTTIPRQNPSLDVLPMKGLGSAPLPGVSAGIGASMQGLGPRRSPA